jgi:eukaryotic-like serine/threonine-protein kinase
VIGRSLGHYRLLERIGAGGIGEVYRGRDEHLARDVAIKLLLPGTLADDQARNRFRKEALALSKLNHPHVATVYDFDTEGETDFLVMEYVTGTGLSERLVPGPLSEQEVTRFGEQIAQALEEAHENGVVHRDLKPGNIRITARDQVKVLDFGLARFIGPVDETSRAATQTQAVTGTLPYMAPEQLRGEAADARTDIWALGAVLYEMATGHRPFEAGVAAVLAVDILTKAPPPPTKINPQVSAHLEQVILKCLAKSPKDRYGSAREVGADLRRLSTGVQISLPAPRPSKRRPARRGSKRIRSLVVLPLTDLTHDPGQEYFADGMTEALIFDLAKLRALKVISRTSAMRYKATDKSLPEIAEELDVDAVVEGSVLRSGGKVRIMARLIDGRLDTQLWAESYEHDMRDVLLLQSEVAQAIARQIKVAVTPEEAKRLAAARPVNPEAYEACLKGRFHWGKLSADHLDTALEYYRLALAKDPEYALAYAGIAAVWVQRTDAGFAPPGEVVPQARAAALKAIELDDTLAEAHISLGNVRFQSEFDWRGAEKEFRRAIQLNPNSAEAHFFYSDFLISMRRLEEARVELERTLELDPLNFGFQCFAGWHLLYRHRPDEAIEVLNKALRIEPNYSSARLALWGAYYQKRMYDEALAEARRFFAVLGDGEVAEALERGFRKGGYPEAMIQTAETMVARTQRAHVPAFRIARLYAQAGEKDRALDWLEKAWQERENPLVHLAVGWDWDTLQEEPRFQDLLRRLGLPSAVSPGRESTVSESAQLKT